jgi:hypothetical protein
VLRAEKRQVRVIDATIDKIVSSRMGDRALYLFDDGGWPRAAGVINRTGAWVIAGIAVGDDRAGSKSIGPAVARGLAFLLRRDRLRPI